MSNLTLPEWKDAFRDPRLLLDRLTDFFHRPGTGPVNPESLPSAFEHVIKTDQSVREYWLQLHLHFKLSLAFSDPRAGLIPLKSEPPAVALASELGKSSGSEFALKWPDLLVHGTDKGKPTFYWWELKWVDGPKKLRRFLVDTWLLSRFDVDKTAEACQKRGGKWAKNLAKSLHPADLFTAMRNGTHIGIALAACSGPEALVSACATGRVEEVKRCAEQWKLQGGDLPSAFALGIGDYWKSELPTLPALLDAPPFLGRLAVGCVESGKEKLGLMCWQDVLERGASVCDSQGGLQR